MDGRLRSMTSLYLMDGERILLLYRMGSSLVSNTYIGSAGGHFEPGELRDAGACVLRELEEETGLHPEDIDGLSLRYVTLRLSGGEIRQNYYFFARLIEPDRRLTSNEGRLEWHAVDALSELPMPFTARFVVDHYLTVGRHTDCLYGGIATEQSVAFHVLDEF